MSKLFQFKDVKINTSRNGFDLSNKLAATAKIGEILPFYWKEVLPGDKFELRHQHFTRTRPVQTAAYTRIREYYDWYFVPLRLLWKSSGTALSMMQENNVQAVSMSEGIQVTDRMPFLNLKNLYYDVLTQFVSRVSLNYFGFQRALLSLKLFNYLGYGNFKEDNVFLFDESSDPSDLTIIKNTTPYRWTGPVSIFPLLAYQKIYNDYFRNSQWENSSPFCWNVDYSEGGLLHLPVGSASADYWNNSTMFDLRYCNWNKDMFMGVLPESQYGDPAMVLSEATSNVTGTVPQRSATISPLPIQGNINISGGSATSMRNLGIKRGSDGNIYMVDAEGNPVNGVSSDTMTNLRTRTASYNIPSQEFTVHMENLNTSFSILALRQQEFLQRWKEVAQSGSQDYKDQMYKQFGVEVPDVLSNLCTYIGGTATNLDISEVVNTNLSGDDSQASIFGKGVGVGEGKETFFAKEHGIIMCVYHALPLLDYSISGIDKQLLHTSAMDYAIPAFDKIGYEELPVFCFSNNSSVSFPGNTPPMLGYVPRYVEYKTSVDRVVGDFINTLPDWVAPVSDEYLDEYFKTDFEGINYNFFKVNPHLLDTIFDVDANSRVSTDQFRINTFFDVKVVRNLDYNGLPY